MTYDRNSYLQNKEAHNFKGASGRRLSFTPSLPTIPIPPSEAGYLYPILLEDRDFGGFVIIGDDLYFRQDQQIFRINLNNRYHVEEVVRFPGFAATSHMYSFGGFLWLMGFSSIHGHSRIVRINLVSKEIAEIGGNLGFDLCIFDEDSRRIYTASITSNVGGPMASRLLSYNIDTLSNVGEVSHDVFFPMGWQEVGSNVSQAIIHPVGIIENGVLVVICARSVGDDGSNVSPFFLFEEWNYPNPNNNVTRSGRLFDINVWNPGMFLPEGSFQQEVPIADKIVIPDSNWSYIDNPYRDGEQASGVRWLSTTQSRASGVWDFSGVLPTGEAGNINLNLTQHNQGNLWTGGGYPNIYRFETSPVSVGIIRELGEEGDIISEVTPNAPGETVSGVTWYIPERMFLNIPSVIPNNNLQIANIRVEHNEEGEGRFGFFYPEDSRYRQRGPYEMPQSNPLNATLQVSPQSASWMTTGVDPLILVYQLPSGRLSIIVVYVFVFERESAEANLEALRQQYGAEALAILGIGVSVLSIGTALIGGFAAAPVTIANTTLSGTVHITTATGQAMVINLAAGGARSASVLATELGRGAAITGLGTLTPTTVIVSGGAVAATGIGGAAGIVGGTVGGEVGTSEGVDANAVVTAPTYSGIRDVPINLTNEGASNRFERIMFLPQQVFDYYDGWRLHPSNTAEIVNNFRFEFQQEGYTALMFIGDSVEQPVGYRYFILCQRLINTPDGDIEVAQDFYVIVEVVEEI